MRKTAVVLALIALAGCARREAPSSSSSSSGEPQKPADAITLTFTYGSEKEAWIKQVTDAFNSAQHKTAAGKPVFVEAIPMGSGDCIDELVNETRKTDVISPASAAFITLGNSQSKAKRGKELIAKTENLVVSPVVIAMWKPMANALGWPQKALGWSDILTLAKNPKGWAAYGHPEWGQFRFGHTHPESSNSGLISVLAEVYAATGKKAGLTIDDVNKPRTSEFVSGIEQSVVHYGSSTGFFGKKMFANGPEYLSAAVLYENMVIDSYSSDYHLPFPIVAIYPREGTFWSDHPIGVVEREWVTPEKREAAKLYIDYLLAKEQQEKAIPFGFRPSSVEVPLAAPVDADHGIDPKEPQTTLEVPQAQVIDSVLQLWHAQKKHSHITLVFDVSGSMNEQGKLVNARAGAIELLKLLSDDDTLSIEPFNNHVRPGLTRAHLKERRGEAEQMLAGLYAGGGTALYDAIGAAYREHERDGAEDADKISAIIVLTDGADTDSGMSLDQLTRLIHSDPEHTPVRIFTIGYGEGAKEDVLKQIADATQAKYYAGNTGNIRAILREISTFF